MRTEGGDCRVGAGVGEGREKKKDKRERREKLRIPESPGIPSMLAPDTQSALEGVRRHRPLSKEASWTEHRHFLQAWAGILCPGACWECTQKVSRSDLVEPEEGPQA